MTIIIFTAITIQNILIINQYKGFLILKFDNIIINTFLNYIL